MPLYIYDYFLFEQIENIIEKIICLLMIFDDVSALEVNILHRAIDKCEETAHRSMQIFEIL